MGQKNGQNSFFFLSLFRTPTLTFTLGSRNKKKRINAIVLIFLKYMSDHPPPPPLVSHNTSSVSTNKGDNKRTADGAFKNAVDAISRLKQANIADMQPMPPVIAPVGAPNANAAMTADSTKPSRPTAPARKKTSSKQRMSFNERIEELRAYGEKHGTVNVPQTCKINPSLGRWCHNMKYVYKRKSEGKSLKGYLNMTDEQVQELRNLGFDFSMSDHSPRKSFEDRLAELEAFKNANGHVNVPSNYAQDPSLGHWASDVRRGSYSLTPDQIQALSDMGFEFKAKSRAPNKSFEERLEECKEYAKIHGHPNVPQGYKLNPLLGQWCDQIRKSYAKSMENNGTGVKGLRLTAQKIQALKDIGVRLCVSYWYCVRTYVFPSYSCIQLSLCDSLISITRL